jgi:mRNA-degrading endonuclease RelE of RelBE toxin-antitoxin system
MDVVLTAQAKDEFDELPRLIKTRVLTLFARLRDWPNVSGAKPPRGNHAGQYRMRTGDFRVQFSVSGHRVVISRIGHRDGFYET